MHRIVIHCRSTAPYAAKHLWVDVIDHPPLRPQRHDGAAHKSGALPPVALSHSFAPQRP